MRIARNTGGKIAFDIDYRPNLWGLAGHGAGEARYIASERVSRRLKSVLADCDLIVGTEEGEIHALDLVDGSDVWTRRLEGEIKGLGLHGNVLYVGTVQGRVYALKLPRDEPEVDGGP